MKLTEHEILELSELCAAVVDGSDTEAEREQLSKWLTSSEEARRFWVRYAGLSAGLCEYAAVFSGEAPEERRRGLRVNWPVARRWALGGMAAAAAWIALAFGLGRAPNDDGAADLDTGELVASLTGVAKSCRWTGGSTALQPGDPLRRGQRLELEAGFVEITFDSGACLTLEGPAALDISSPWGAVLRQGTIRAHVPPEAVGFRVSNPAVEVIDLGTEFSMVADAAGDTEVFVLRGAVQAAKAGGIDTVVLREKESRRFSRRGMFAVADPERKLARLAQPVGLDRIAGPLSFVHWRFDEPDGVVAKAETSGIEGKTYDARWELDPGPARVEGRWKGALDFNGRVSAVATFPGIGTKAARTVAFWLKIPADAPPGGGCTMVAWGEQGAKRHMPVQIGWNRHPDQGAFGALRTERGRDFAVGSTSLRDGQWHHVAVVLVPAGGRLQRMNVSQYVDGRLEGTTLSRAKGRAAAFAEDSSEPSREVVCLGRGYGGHHSRRERFLGSLDELFIAGRALGPFQIQQLIRTNHPSLSEIASITHP